MNSKVNVVLHYFGTKKRYVAGRSTLKQKIVRRFGLSPDCILERKVGEKWYPVEPDSLNDFDHIRVVILDASSSKGAVNPKIENPYMYLRHKLKKNLPLSPDEIDFICDVLDTTKKSFYEDKAVQAETGISVGKYSYGHKDLTQVSLEQTGDLLGCKYECITAENEENWKPSDGYKKSEVGNRRKKAKHGNKSCKKIEDKKLFKMQELMKNELKQMEPSEEGIRNLMDLTFPARRSYILSGSPHVRQVQRNYPALFNVKEVIREFHRIRSDVCFERYKKNLEKFSHDLIQNAQKSAESLISNLLQKKLLRTDSKEKENYYKSTAAILLLPFHLNESLAFISFGLGKSSVFPVITCNKSIEEVFDEETNFTVRVEMHELCSSKSLIEAFFAFVAAFYIFNIEYASEYKKTVTHTETVFIGMVSG